MKKLGILVILLLSSTLFYAQRGERMSPEERQAKTIESLTKSVDLSEDQVTQVTAFYEIQTTKMENLRSNGGDDREQMRAEMQELNAETDASVLSILSEDQVVKFEAYKQERDERMAERKQQGGQKKGKRERN